MDPDPTSLQILMRIQLFEKSQSGSRFNLTNHNPDPEPPKITFRIRSTGLSYISGTNLLLAYILTLNNYFIIFVFTLENAALRFLSVVLKERFRIMSRALRGFVRPAF